MRRIQTGFLLILIALVLGILNWAYRAWLGGDEPGFLLSVLFFKKLGYFSTIHNGIYGKNTFITLGPTITLPAAAIDAFVTVNAIWPRFLLIFTQIGLFYWSGRLLGLSRKSIPVAGVLFLLWILTMPCEFPARCEGSLQPLAHFMGEGVAFGFLLLCFSAFSVGKPGLAWIAGTLAIGCKTQSVLLLWPIGLALMWDGIKKKKFGFKGLVTALVLIMLWQAWLLHAQGWTGYVESWNAFLENYTMVRSDPLHSLSLGDRLGLLERYSGDNLILSLLLLLCAVVFLGLNALGFSLSEVLPNRFSFSILAAIFSAAPWFLLVSARPWMRYLWPCFAFAGAYFSFLVVKIFESTQPRSEQSSVRLLLPSVAALIFIGIGFAFRTALIALFTLPFDSSAQWKTQQAVAIRLNAMNPEGRWFAKSWQCPSGVAFLGKRVPWDLDMHEPKDGEIGICDNLSGGCDYLTAYCDVKALEGEPAYPLKYCALKARK